MKNQRSYVENSFTVRDAEASDLREVIGLIVEMERTGSRKVTVSETELLRDYFGANAVMHMVVAEHHTKVIGYASWNLTYSNHIGRHRMYMAELCVTENSRGLGAGRAIVEHLHSLCAANGYERLEWRALIDSPARLFYDKLGSTLRSDSVFYNLSAQTSPSVSGSVDELSTESARNVP